MQRYDRNKYEEKKTQGLHYKVGESFTINIFPNFPHDTEDQRCDISGNESFDNKNEQYRTENDQVHSYRVVEIHAIEKIVHYCKNKRTSEQ